MNDYKEYSRALPPKQRNLPKQKTPDGQPLSSLKSGWSAPKNSLSRKPSCIFRALAKTGQNMPYFLAEIARIREKSYAMQEKPLRKSPGILRSQRFSEGATIWYTTESGASKIGALRGRWQGLSEKKGQITCHNRLLPAAVEGLSIRLRILKAFNRYIMMLTQHPLRGYRSV